MSDLAAVRDLDCVKSFAPLVFDLSATEITGASAVLRRVLYRWCTPKGSLRYALDVGPVRALLDLDGATFSPSQLEGLRTSLYREAMEEDFVDSVSVALSLNDAGLLTVAAKVRLVDGRDYPLEVSASASGAALLALGGS